MANPNRATTAGAAFIDLRALAKMQGRNVAELLDLYLLEGATLGRARLTFHVDVNVGDPVRPTPRPVTVPGLLGGHVELLGYPLPAVHAERIVTALQRGTSNTRWRDFADVHLLRAQQDLDGTDLTTALHKVAEHRRVTLRPLSEALTGYAQLGRTRYRAWVQRRDLTDRLPDQFAELLDAVQQLADPALAGHANGYTWNHITLAWT